MKFPTSGVRRTLEATFVNSVVNHADVIPWVGCGRESLDLSSIVADPRNVTLVSDHAALIFHRMGDGRFEVHSQCLQEGRGPHFAKAAADAVRYVFAATDCVEIITRVPDGNLGAHAAAKRAGFVPTLRREAAWTSPTGERVGVQFYALGLERWRLTDRALTETGASFHAWLEDLKGVAPEHGDDPDHNAAVGMAATMLRAGNGQKAAHHYERWAVLAGYQPLELLSEQPLVVDVGEAILEMRRGEPTVLLLR